MVDRLRFPRHSIPGFDDDQNEALRKILWSLRHPLVNPFVRLMRTTGQATTNGNVANVQWQAESGLFPRTDYPALTLGSLTDIPIHWDGLLHVKAQLRYSANAAGVRLVIIQRVRDGTAVEIATPEINSGQNTTLRPHASDFVPCNRGDFIRVSALQTAGNLNVQGVAAGSTDEGSYSYVAITGFPMGR